MSDEDFEAVLRQFRREMLGESVSHMGDDELRDFLEPWRVVDVGPPGLPAWFLKRRQEARARLVSVLGARLLQLWMRDTMRELHKSPYLREGEWERMLETYRACFPGCPGPGS